MQPPPQTPPPLLCTRCGAQNDPFASQCHACGARNAFGPPAYEEPISPPPTGKTRDPSSAGPWWITIGVLLICARVILFFMKMSSSRHAMYVPPLTIPTFAPTAIPTSLAVEATLPPARRFALADDERALAFDDDRLQAHTSAGKVKTLAEISGSLAPRKDSPIFVVAESAYWIAIGDAEIVGVSTAAGSVPSVIVKHAQAIGGLGADDKSIWYTASDGKSGRKLMRAIVTAAKINPTQVATWTSSRTSEPFIVTDTDVFIVEPTDTNALSIVRVPKAGGHSTTLITLPAQEEIGTLAASADMIYFTTGAPHETPRDLYRVLLTGGERAKLFSSKGGVGDVVVADKDVVVADRPNTAWEIDSLPAGDVAQITIVASDVGRQPHLCASPGHIAWSTSSGVSFGAL